MDSTLSTLNELDKSEISNSVNCNIEDISKHFTINKNDLTIITQNIRSIYKNFEDLQITLSNLKHEVDIIILTECRLDSNKPIPQLNNYTPYVTTNHQNQNDGVVAYIKSNLKPKIKEIKLIQASCLQIDIFNYTVLGVYRSPSNTNTDKFLDSLQLSMDKIKSCKNIILTGDININLISKLNDTSSECKNRGNYLNTLSTYGLLPGHQIATRDNSCLDHFILKLQGKKVTANIAVMNTTITDHKMVILSLAKIKFNKICPKTKTYIDFDKALLSLSNQNLSSLLLCEDPNSLIEILINKITESLRENTRITNIPKSKRIIKPWITEGVLRCIRNRNKMQKELKTKPEDNILKITYRRYRNYCNNLIKKLKRIYDRQQLLTKNPKVLWDNIKTITNTKQTRLTNTELLDIEPCPVKSVNAINSFFANVGRNLAEDILKNKQMLLNTTSLPSNEAQATSFALLNTDCQEIKSILLNLKSDSAPGIDNIPIKFLKMASDLIVPILCHLANLCFSKGTFPTLLKQAIITPIYKGGERTQVNNYRPISVLTGLSKILEKLINNRLLSFIKKYKILSDSQYGFRQGKCTQDAIIDLTACIVDQLDKRNKCLTVFLDLKKAFDTVSIPMLLGKLGKIGIRGKQLDLFKDYLTGRTQRVKIGDYTSNDLQITFGVPQGSILGPTLFLIYINDLCNLNIKNGQIYSYADDTAIVFYGRSWDEVFSVAERNLKKISTWLNLNSLSLNTAKTNYVCFTINKRTQPKNINLTIHHCDTDQISCTCPKIQKVDTVKYLGILLDQRLSWHAHIEVLSGRVRKLIWLFKSLRHVASSNLLNQVYTALAQSILTYCIPVWGGATKTKFLGLERSQRILLKVMYKKHYRFPTDKLYSMSNVLSVRKLYILHLLLCKHKNLNKDTNLFSKRRVRIEIAGANSFFAKHQYIRQSAYVYTKVNRMFNIVRKHPYNLKQELSIWLQKLSYTEAEALLETTS